MSSLIEQLNSLDSDEHDEPASYAPRSWRERFEAAWSEASPESAAPASGPAAARPPAHDPAAPAALDAELERVVYEALRHAREPERPEMMAQQPGMIPEQLEQPELVSERVGLVAELDRRLASIGPGGRFAAAIGVSAIVALFFVFIVPASHEFAGQGAAAPFGTVQSMKAALNEPLPATDDTRPALCELQSVLGPPQAQPAATHEQSENLLQQFMQWREKPLAEKAP
jgi:hypothetical protein